MFEHLAAEGYGDLRLISDLDTDEAIPFTTLYQQSMKLRQDLQFYPKLGTEGLGDFVKRILGGLVNTVMHVVHTFKTNIFKFYRDLKRSELRYYHEANTLSVRRILNTDFASLADLQVPVPNGMIRSYPETVGALEHCLTVADMSSRSRAIKASIKAIHDRAISRQTVGDTTVLQDDTFALPGVTSAFNTVLTCLTNKNTHMMRYATVFPTATDLKQVDDELLRMEKFQLEVSGVASCLGDIEQYAHAILDFLAKTPDAMLTKEDLQSLSVICTAMAKLFDIYGVCCQDLHRVENNFVECLKLIRRTYNL